MKRLFLIIALVTSHFGYAAENTVLVFIRDDVYNNYVEFLNGRNVEDVTDFSGPFIRRDVVDMIIAQQALHFGGFNRTYEYAAGKINFRNTRMLIEGQLLISFDTYWQTDALELQNVVYISDPIIRKGEYYAGLFTNPQHPTLFNLKTKDDLKNYTAVSTPKWKTDWQTLNALPLKELIREDEWVSQAQMVNKGWVDFFLMPFHKNVERGFEFDNVLLMPVPKVAVLLNDSRHFVISKSHPLGNEAFKAIQAGLKLLRAQGRITSAYSQAGFLINSADYTILNAP